MNTFSKVAPPPKLAPATDDHRYGQEIARRSVLAQRIADVREQIDALVDKIAQTSTGMSGSLDDRVAQAIASPGGTFEPLPSFAELRLELGRAQGEAAVLERAIAKQNQTCQEVLAEVSRDAAAKVKAEHRRRVAAIGQALEDLRAAAQAEADLHREMAEAGYAAALESFQVPRLHTYILDLYGAAWGQGDFVERVRNYVR